MDMLCCDVAVLSVVMYMIVVSGWSLVVDLHTRVDSWY